MTIHKFKSELLEGYLYDSDNGTVISTKRSKPNTLTWQSTPGRGRWYDRVVLTTTRGDRFPVIRNDISSMIVTNPTAKNLADLLKPNLEQAAAKSDLGRIKPNYPYVLFSPKHQCSQYFFANTSIKEALEKFARRNIVIAPADIRILNTQTNEVKSLGVQTVTIETYSLD